jgi:serine/threonine-protein kinase
MDVDARIGTVLCGKWTLERLLGSGGMASVYVGLHKIGRRDAIKILHPQIARDEQLRARFDQEAHAANRFVHPGAVEIRDINVTEDGCPFLVMELLEGEALRARYDRLGPPDTAEILRIVDNVLDVLAAAHAQGIIHRDIKPDNLFYLPGGRIKVLDFGVARVANELQTRTGTALGTLPYMPPEQIKGMDIDVRVDLFALGATMFRLITKRHIHQGRSDAELLVKMATLPAPPLASVAPETPASLCAIVDRALAFDRERRYPSATAMQQDIRALRSGQNQSAPVDQEPPTTVMAAVTKRPTTTLRERRLRWAALVFPLVGAGVLALVFYGMTRVDGDEAGPRDPAFQTAMATTGPANEVKPIEPAVAPNPTGPGPGSPATIGVNCLLTHSCDQMCDRSCTFECRSRTGCTIGAAPDANVQCTGPSRCEVSCASNCKIKSQGGAPLLVHCPPGFECELEDCPGDVERCSPSLLACGTPCPD